MKLPFAKPPKTPKRAPRPLQRKTELRSRSPLSRGEGMGRKPRKAKVKPRNDARRKREFARCYGSKERVAWVKSLPCVYCVAYLPILAVAPNRPISENAHTVTGGKGRKADAETIVPLCRNHHQKYDQHQHPFDNREIRDAIKSIAPKIEAAWQAHVSGQGGKQ